MNDEWIVVPNWDKFQHYKDRSPNWIKVYTELNSRDEWLALTLAERGMLTTIWVEYARSRGHLRVGKVMSLCGVSARSRHLASLNHAGFIELSASKLSRARARSARERGTSYPQERASTTATANGRASPPQEEESAEPPRDPEALARIRALADQIGRQ